MQKIKNLFAISVLVLLAGEVGWAYQAYSSDMPDYVTPDSANITPAAATEASGGTSENGPMANQVKPGECKNNEILPLVSPSFNSLCISIKGSGTTSSGGNSNLTLSANLVINKINEANQSCNAKQRFSCGACLSQLSTYIQGAAAGIGGILALVQGVSTITNACSKFNDATMIIQAGVTAYNATCSGTLAVCSSSCKKADLNYQNSILELQKISFSAKTEPQVIATVPNSNYPGCKALSLEIDRKISELNTTTKTKIVANIEQCKKYKWNMVAAGAGLTATLAQAFRGHNCEKKTTASCESNPNDIKCLNALTDCTKPENQSKQICICKLRPATLGCGIYNSAGGGEVYQTQKTNKQGKSEGGFDKVGAGGNVAGGTSIRDSKSGDDAGGSAGAGSSGSSGGSAGFSPVGSSAGSGSGKNATDVAKKLNTNILSEGDGGGGGGGSRGGGGGYADVYANSGKYKPYMPKIPGEHDASERNPSAENQMQVTGGGGKSNWEKIRERYIEQQSKLNN